MSGAAGAEDDSPPFQRWVGRQFEVESPGDGTRFCSGIWPGPSQKKARTRHPRFGICVYLRLAGAPGQSHIGSKVKNHTVNLVANEFQKQVKWGVLHNPRLVNRYTDEELHILIRFRCGEGKEFAACLQGFFGELKIDEDAQTLRIWRTGSDGSLRRRLRALAWRHSIREARKPQGKQQFVLVDNVKSVELPEKVISTLVWVETVEALYRKLPHALYFSGSLGPVLVGGVTDWETAYARWLISSSFDHSTGDVVKSGPEIVDCVPGDGGEVEGDARNFDGIKADISRFRIDLASDFVWIEIPEFCESGVQLLDVLIGPLILG